jgi:hypothetical protein
MKITPNIGVEDRLIRILVGLALIVNIFVLYPLDIFWIVVLAVAGVALLLTAYFRFCSLYLPFGITTLNCKCEENKAEEK